MLELAGIIILGIFAQWIAWRVRVPAILPLILTGLAVGPLSTFFTADGEKLLEPMYKAGQESLGIFPDKYLFSFVSLSIGVILFEGGLTLKRREIAGVGPAILKLITFGPLATFFGGGMAAHYILGLNWPVSLLFGALVIVTGPTVIAPILQNIPLNRNVSTVLKWEGILIDPIGALVAVLVFEFIRSSQGGLEFTSHAFVSFFRIIMIGLSMGTLAALALYQLIKAELIPHYLLNVFTLAFVLGVFVFSNILAHESGLLSVVVMGMFMGNLDVPRLKEILSFKESLSVLLISILFIILAANIDMDDINIILNDWRALALFFVVIFVLRPLGVFISTWNSDLRLSEKLFISWVGPRGIVAAGIASLFGITLTSEAPTVPDAEFLVPLVFMIVLGTVLLNATTARMVAKVLKVTQDASEGILIIGANGAARLIGKYLQDNNRHVVLIDNNEGSVKKAREAGLEAFAKNIYTDDLGEEFELLDMGYMVAMTSSADVNLYVVRKYRKIFGENGTFRLITPEELKKDRSDIPQQGIFSYTDDFLNLNEVARDYPAIHEVDVSSQKKLQQVYDLTANNKDTVPLFIKTDTGSLEVIPPKLEEISASEGFQMVYLGKKLEAAEME
ncbi:MAG: sodium:proton antiporter [Phaeodactylibacter sp.]|nr:sodium:proton antiporter [Phaeodactylibacter sp.]MCB9266710.1 sodium:proton antiporter [Lewinellaceae bacterium]